MPKKAAKKKTTKKNPVNNTKGKKDTVTNQQKIANRQFRDLIDNAMTTRSQLLSSLLDPRRNINDECGYPNTNAIKTEDYKTLYKREAIAARVVEVFPDESWKSVPQVVETEDPDDLTPFEEAWNNLSTSTHKSFLDNSVSHSVWEPLYRTDILSGIGSYGTLLIGLSDGKHLDEPVEPNENLQITFLKPTDQSLSRVLNLEENPTDPRFGRPKMYQITFNDPGEQTDHAITGGTSVTQDVHWSRIIHVADNRRNSDVFGVPRLRDVYNRVYDTRKVYSGSAEMYWRGAFPGISVETHPQLGGDVVVDHDAMRSQMENYMNGLQRYLSLSGMQAKSLSPQVVDPNPQLDAQIKAICIAKGVPKRIFEGSERGELASSQDARAWNTRMARRQNEYLSPLVIAPFIDRLIEFKILPEPVEGYKIVWPDLDTLTDEEIARVALIKTEALAKYIQGSVEVVIPPAIYLTKFLGTPQEEAIETLEAAVEAEPLIEEEEDDNNPIAEENGDAK